jgi:hypothetical protein
MTSSTFPIPETGQYYCGTCGLSYPAGTAHYCAAFPGFTYTSQPDHTKEMLALLKEQSKQQAEMVQGMVEALKEQAKVLQAYLDLFKVTDKPISRTLRDSDEAARERSRIDTELQARIKQGLAD